MAGHSGARAAFATGSGFQPMTAVANVKFQDM